MIIDDNFNVNGNNFKNNNDFINLKKRHQNDGIISKENNLLTRDLSTFSHIDPADSKTMSEMTVAMLQQRYKNKTISQNDFTKKCTDFAKNRQ